MDRLSREEYHRQEATHRRMETKGVKEGQEYSILTATIAKGAFGLTSSEHSKLKGFKKENLHDHMTLIELILIGLIEEVTRQITVGDEVKGFHANLEADQKG